jgi:Wiskott-Aldrich syndrome protein
MQYEFGVEHEFPTSQAYAMRPPPGVAPPTAVPVPPPAERPPKPPTPLGPVSSALRSEEEPQAVASAPQTRAHLHGPKADSRKGSRISQPKHFGHRSAKAWTTPALGCPRAEGESQGEPAAPAAPAAPAVPPGKPAAPPAPPDTDPPLAPAAPAVPPGKPAAPPAPPDTDPPLAPPLPAVPPWKNGDPPPSSVPALGFALSPVCPPNKAQAGAPNATTRGSHRQKASPRNIPPRVCRVGTARQCRECTFDGPG